MAREVDEGKILLNGALQWPPELKARALAIAEASTMREAAEATGIPTGTISRWRKELGGAHIARRPKKMQELVEAATEEAKADVAAHVAKQGKALADKLMQLVELAADQAIGIIEQGPGGDDTQSQWLRAVVGVIAQGVEKHQLLTGKATSRTEDVSPFAGLSTEELRKLAQAGGVGPESADPPDAPPPGEDGKAKSPRAAVN